ncbi:GMC family oxidoreductase [Ideonella livida]|uniref:GMC family oxidoreductase n=1 Tax=Ideonella livida TaxID=2707176 RepID=A0A7C9PIA1_9BURK|nr:GMC family oxidoreductase [Ideonella livida]NDY91872.1 GMC family oxidoreductase [Ideonella livida]
MTQDAFDAIVVGSGATGGIAAKELTERGLKVLVLEAGGPLPEEKFELAAKAQFAAIGSWARIKAGLSGQHKQALTSFYSPEKAFLFVNDNEHPYESPEDFYLWLRGKQVGGRFLAWGRVALRMSDYTFKFKSHEGAGFDWPIGYADLAPWYERVERFLGIVGNDDGIDYCPSGAYVRPAGLSQAEQKFKAAVEGRFSDAKVMAWRYVRKEATPADAQRHRTTTPLQAAAATGNLTLRAHSPVERVNTDARTGRATGVTYIDKATGQRHEVRANVVMLCASTIESIRLLLNSKAERHPHGLGNSSGLVGRYFMDQMLTLGFGTAPGFKGGELVDGTSPADNHGGIYVPRFRQLKKPGELGYAGGFNLQGIVGRPMLPAHLDSVFGLTGHGEILPHVDNRVQLAARRDRLGVPIPSVSVRLRDNDLKLLRDQVQVQKEVMKAAGLQADFLISPLGISSDGPFMPSAKWYERLMFRLAYKRSVAVGGAIHECGGARMGDDPKTSVLNAHNQVWDAPNVFVTDSSCFVTNGTCGPTLTTMALTARACGYIASEYGHSPALSA